MPGRLAHATVTGNVVFAFVTGTSLASATAFTSIAYPQMRRYGYDTSFSLGLISGSACLGMLIPPSLLMIVWGILTEQSIGAIFLAGVLPGLVLAASHDLLHRRGVDPATVGRGRGRCRGIGDIRRRRRPGGRRAGPERLGSDARAAGYRDQLAGRNLGRHLHPDGGRGRRSAGSRSPSGCCAGSGCAKSTTAFSRSASRRRRSW